MRPSLRTAGALAGAFLIGMALGPDTSRIGRLRSAVAQEGRMVEQSKFKNAVGSERAGRARDERIAVANDRRSAEVFRLLHEHPESSDTGRNPRIEAALEEAVTFKVEPQRLSEALDLLASRLQIPILLDQNVVDELNVGKKEVKLDVVGVSLRDTLELILDSTESQLGFEVRAGVLTVNTVDHIDEHLQAVVYDCRDLVTVGTLDHFPSDKTAPMETGGGGGGSFQLGGGGMFQAAQEAAKPPSAPPAAPEPGPAGPQVSLAEDKRLPLIQTILAATENTWGEDPSKTITEFGGLIIVRQSPRVHEKIKALLADIRRMRDNGAYVSFAKQYDTEMKRREIGAVNRLGPKENRATRPLPLTAK